MKIQTIFKPLTLLFETPNFRVGSLEFDSEILKNRILPGSTRVQTLIMLPKNWDRKSIVYNLSGLAGNGTFQLNLKFNSENSLQEISRLVTNEQAPPSVYIFVDSMNALGGTQFINSPMTGLFEDHFMLELIPAVDDFLAETYSSEWNQGVKKILYGGSSGGYGVLHLMSKFPDQFSVGIAVAPDSAFELSLLPDCLDSLPDLAQFGMAEIVEQIKIQNFKNKRNSFKITNAVAMAACYCPEVIAEIKNIPFPLEYSSARTNSTWDHWLSHDPCQFLRNRIDNVKKVKKIWLSVGKFDEHYLLYGARRIAALLSEAKVDYTYSEFAGGHRDLSTQRQPALKWLHTYLREIDL